MPRRGLARLVPVALAMALSLAACGDGDTEPPAGDASSPTTVGSDTLALAVTREGDTFTPNGERVELAVDQALVLTITADEAGVFHVHSTPEQEVAYDAGTSEHEITIDRPGVVEVESHEPDSIVLQLEVR